MLSLALAHPTVLRLAIAGFIVGLCINPVYAQEAKTGEAMKTAEAKRLVKLAEEDARKIDDDLDRAMAHSYLAAAQIRFVPLVDLIKKARAANVSWTHTEIHRTVATRLAQNNRLDDALKVARLMDWEKGQTFLFIAQQHAAKGDIRKAKAIASSISDLRKRQGTFAIIACEQVKSGHVAEAYTTAKDQKLSKELYAWIQEELAVRLAKTGKFDRARTETQKIADRRTRNRTLKRIAEIAAKAVNWDETATTARMIDDLFEKSRAHLAIAAVRLELTQKDEAIKQIDLSKSLVLRVNRHERELLYAQIAPAVAQTGNIQAALELIERHITEGANAYKAYASIALFQARSGDFKAAQQTTGRIKSPFSKALTYRQLTQNICQTQKPDETEKWIRELADPYDRAMAYSALIESLVGQAEGQP